MHEVDQDALLRAARAGDEAAFVILFRIHRDPVYRFAYRLPGSAEGAEDVTQECFLGLLGSLRRYDSARASLRTYLLASVRNLALKQLRRRRPEVAIEDYDVPGQPATETKIAVRRAVEALPLGQREPLILFAGPVVWFSPPGHGRILLTLRPREGYEFRKAGEIRDDRVLLRLGGDEIEIRTSASVLTRGAWNVYALEDLTGGRSSAPDVGFGAAGRVEYLLPRR